MLMMIIPSIAAFQGSSGVYSKWNMGISPPSQLIFYITNTISFVSGQPPPPNQIVNLLGWCEDAELFKKSYEPFQ